MEIKPYHKNAKKHPKKQIKALADIVELVGWRQPVLVNQDKVIVAGHGRWITWIENKDRLKEIWVIDDKGNTVMGEPETTPLTKEQEKIYRLADNKLNESDWEMELVIEELKELTPQEIDLTGFDKDLAGIDIHLIDTQDLVKHDIKEGEMVIVLSFDNNDDLKTAMEKIKEAEGELNYQNIKISQK